MTYESLSKFYSRGRQSAPSPSVRGNSPRLRRVGTTFQPFLPTFLLGAALSLALPALPALPQAPDSTEESPLIALLQSDASPRQKDEACARLKRVGTARAVPALAALLGDEQLSHSARLVLESMPAPEAGRALTGALATTAGLIRVGIIQSLAERREAGAVPGLVRSLGETDPTVAAAAAVALGSIGGREAAQALQEALKMPQAIPPAALRDGLLRVANRMLDEGSGKTAVPIFKLLTRPSESEPVRAAACLGLIRTADDGGLALVKTGLEGKDTAAQTAALQMARLIKNPSATKVLAGLLVSVPIPVRIALLQALSQRGDPAAAPAVLKQAQSTEVPVRVTALDALGRLGDASAVPVLVQAAAAPDPSVQKSARQALLEIQGDEVAQVLIAQLASDNAAIQSEIVRALSNRGDKAAVSRLLELAATEPEAIRPGCVRALALLADGSHVRALIGLLRDARSDAGRLQLQETLMTVCQRAQGRPGWDASPIVEGLSAGEPRQRAALLPLCGLLRDPRLHDALRASVADADPQVRSAAQRALCDAHDVMLLPDILRLARTADDPGARLLAFRGYVRLAAGEDATALSPPQRARVLQDALALARNAEEKRLVLAGLAGVPSSDALALVSPLLDNTEVQAEAAAAAVAISGAIRQAHPEAARAALKKVAVMPGDAGRRQTAESLLREMDAASDYITAWEVAGPYQQAGQDFTALFDLPFPPEKPDSKYEVWLPLPAGTDPKQPGLLDLLKFLGGEQRVAYARTRIYSATEQPARLELGSDDGVKVWLNGQLLHSHNIARALTPGSDKVGARLKAGWNPLLLKITQNNQGWAFCARFTRPDGTRLEGLRFEPAGGE